MSTEDRPVPRGSNKIRLAIFGKPYFAILFFFLDRSENFLCSFESLVDLVEVAAAAHCAVGASAALTAADYGNFL